MANQIVKINIFDKFINKFDAWEVYNYLDDYIDCDVGSVNILDNVLCVVSFTYSFNCRNIPFCQNNLIPLPLYRN